MARADRRSVGFNAEQLAFEYLCRRGLDPVARNFRSRRGEIDLIMLDEACLVFIEVRYRAGRSFVDAIETVDVHKQRKLISAASFFLARKGAFQNHVCRFDVVGVDKPSSGDVEIRWIKDAFRSEY